MTQVVPHIADTKVPLVREYRAAIDKYKPTMPTGVGDGSYQPKSSYSFGSLEGYLNTKLLGSLTANAYGNRRTNVYVTVTGPLGYSVFPFFNLHLTISATAGGPVECFRPAGLNGNC